VRGGGGLTSEELRRPGKSFVGWPTKLDERANPGKSLPGPARRPRLAVHGKGGGPKNEFFQDA
ncbi:MAG TPA: hypothetical protein PLZ93_08100, partial [Nocardioides sp.]|nr:hypothetical protein [Nocardioides sp.]